MKIDLIIPCYNAFDTLFRALSSVAVQRIVDDVHVCLVDDASTDTLKHVKYAQLLSSFRPALDIELIELPKNSGPGEARQAGIDATTSPYLAFLDADDVLHDTYSLAALLNEAEREKCEVVTSDFVEELSNGMLAMHKQDFTWMFAKLYSRDFLQMHGIRFNPEYSYANEDSGFNTMVNLLSTPGKVHHVPKPTYVWSGRAESLTRKEDGIYSFREGFEGFIRNQIAALNYVLRKGADLQRVKIQILSVFFSCYSSSVDCLLSDKHAEQTRSLMSLAQNFYMEFKETLLAMFPTPEFIDNYRRVLSEKVILPVTIYDFITALDEKNVSLIDELMQQHVSILHGR